MAFGQVVYDDVATSLFQPVPVHVPGQLSQAASTPMDDLVQTMEIPPAEISLPAEVVAEPVQSSYAQDLIDAAANASRIKGTNHWYSEGTYNGEPGKFKFYDYQNDGQLDATDAFTFKPDHGDNSWFVDGNEVSAVERAAFQANSKKYWEQDDYLRIKLDDGTSYLMRKGPDGYTENVTEQGEPLGRLQYGDNGWMEDIVAAYNEQYPDGDVGYFEYNGGYKEFEGTYYFDKYANNPDILEQGDVFLFKNGAEEIFGSDIEWVDFHDDGTLYEHLGEFFTTWEWIGIVIGIILAVIVFFACTFA